MYITILRIIMLLLIPALSIAASSQGASPAGIGRVAQNMMEPVGIFEGFIDSACIGIGASFLIAAIIKYVEHRRSPLMVPISTVIFLVVAGIVLLLLPFLSGVTEGGVAIHN